MYQIVISLVLLALSCIIVTVYFYKTYHMNSKRIFLVFSCFICILYVCFYSLTNKYGYCNYVISIILLIFILMILSVEDLLEKKVTTRFFVYGALLGTIMIIINPNVTLISHVVFAIVLLILLMALKKVVKNGIGKGDIYTISLITLFIGIKLSLSILLFSLVLVGFIGLILLISKKVNKKTTIPFIPFILIATLVIILI